MTANDGIGDTNAEVLEDDDDDLLGDDAPDDSQCSECDSTLDASGNCTNVDCINCDDFVPDADDDDSDEGAEE